MVDNDQVMEQIPNETEIMNFITENRPGNDERRVIQNQRRTSNGGQFVNDGQQPSTSRDVNDKQTPAQKADKLIRDAEMVKARILDAPGKYAMNNRVLDMNSDFVHSAMVDESFLLVASHIDQNTYEKIVSGDFVDFARLIPKDKVLLEEDNKMQLVNKDGQTFFVPAGGDKTVINSFGKWEQAFRDFSDVYTRAHPNRSSELVQYNHIIHTASMYYMWDNVYLYDKDFRLHMSRHPSRSWTLMLQQSWTLRLKDKIRYDSDNNKFSPNAVTGSCKRFNRGKCSYRHNCKYDHRCLYCNKVGHGVVHCRQLKFDRNDVQRNGGDRYHKDNRDGGQRQNSNAYQGSNNTSHNGQNSQNNQNNQNKQQNHQQEKK